ncbi:hypothetical protein O3M35_006396 [Rhynocoris fuscipes]|uniref:Uncharacterized protein n=1 Tax=Rhynocoris fuscipes TaxID=488301 RepID=A0AAW1DDC5_9HEMI
MTRTTINRTASNLTNIGLVLSAVYLNLSINTANGSEYYHYGQALMPGGIPIPAAGVWPGSLGRYNGNYGYNRYYTDGGNDLNGYKNRGGFYDDLLSSRNTYDVGKTYGGGYDYGRGGVIGGGYRDLDGRNTGHQAAGFSTSYRKDESGDKRTYYDDGLGQHGKIKYGAHDSRFRDVGGLAKKGGYHDSNLNRNALGNTGKYGDSYGFRGYNTHGTGYTGQGGGYDGYGRYGNYGGYGTLGGYRGFRSARLLQQPTFSPPVLKKTAVYVIPMPEKLYFDTTVVPQS